MLRNVEMPFPLPKKGAVAGLYREWPPSTSPNIVRNVCIKAKRDSDNLFYNLTSF